MLTCERCRRFTIGWIIRCRIRTAKSAKGSMEQGIKISQHPVADRDYTLGMRPFFVGAAFVLMAALTPVVAQHGGGHVSGGGHGGFGGHSGFSGRSGGGFSGAHSASAAQSGARGFSHSIQFQLFAAFLATLGSEFQSCPVARGVRGITLSAITAMGYGCGYGYPYYPYLGGGVNPYWWWNSGSPNDQDKRISGCMRIDMGAQNYQAQPGDQDAYARPPLRRARKSMQSCCRRPYWCSAISTSRKCRTTPLWAGRCGASLRSTRRKFH